MAYPILMARTVGLTDHAFYLEHIKKAADFLVAHGPSFGSERWEEQSGYSPSTISAEIAGLAAAGWIADHNGDAAGARVYRATADHYQRNVKNWTLTTNGPLSADPYFIRLSKNGDPNAAITYNLGNGGPDADQRAVIDQGFLEYPRLGILPADDADVARSLGIVDDVIKATTPSGTGFYRYGVDTPGRRTATATATSTTRRTALSRASRGQASAERRARTRVPGTSGRSCPASGRSSTSRPVTGRRRSSCCPGWPNTASGVGLIPEQAWENPDLAAVAVRHAGGVRVDRLHRRARRRAAPRR